MKIALIGNPNCGKTTLFNRLTGSAAHVGNWPGVTVERREGIYRGPKTGCCENMEIVDLPGIYSLSPYTSEEVVSRNYMIDERPDLVINIVDATCLERNLYLTTQVLEVDVPVIVALNMTDAVERDGGSVDATMLERELGVPTVSISALTGAGVDELMARASRPEKRRGVTVLGGKLEHGINRAVGFYESNGAGSPLFRAIKLLENDELELARDGAPAVRDEIVGELGPNVDLEAMIADERYKYITARLIAARRKTVGQKISKSERIDGVLTHRVFALPIFAAILFAIFHVTFSEDFLFVGGIAKLFGDLPKASKLGLSEWGTTLVSIFYDGAIFSPGVALYNMFDILFSTIAEAVGGAIAPEWLSGLIADGVLGGLFAVLGFLPQILMLFLWFSVLEDTGYMARAAFVLDRIFRRFGLSGRSFMPMIMGFGCAVPAMINTRTLASDDERTATVRVIPFFSCGAKLPILSAIAGAIVAHFGIGNADLITYGMYLLGIVSAFACVIIMHGTTMKGDAAPFIMELPTYRRPRFTSLMLHLWDKAKHFVKKAFTVIFASTVIVWLLSHLDFSWRYLADDGMDGSILASLGKLMQPVFTPLGFGAQLGAFGWVFAVAAVTGLVAKENVIATFGTLGACLIALGASVGDITGDMLLADEDGITSAVAMISATGITVPGLIAFIAFNMLTVPCFAACATARAELGKGTFKYTLLFWLTASYVISAVVYTVGEWPLTAFAWAAVAAIAACAIKLRKKFPVSLEKKKPNGASSGKKILGCGCGGCSGCEWKKRDS